MKSHKEFKPTLEELGKRIYQLRILKDLTTKQMAPMISLTPEAYRNIERGESDPSTGVLAKTRLKEPDPVPEAGT